ncbi:MAG TPA: hypothetical protein VHA13_04080, partial [Gammaproteobacteria bacterium]|nr:hypothetical protein [Gammaproteobacteria bacterium]
ARVIAGKQHQWQFRVIGVLYARCSASWYNESSIKTQIVANDKKLVCAIPIQQEFSQILAIIFQLEAATRNKLMTAACTSLGDEKAINDAIRYSAISSKNEDEAKAKIKKFEAGDSPLNIQLPDGLEKLWYRDIVAIEDSLLIKKVLERELDKKAPNFFKSVPAVSAKDLKDDFNAFMEVIKTYNSIDLKKDDNKFTSPSRYFRVDIVSGGLNNAYWVLDVQDNTGRITSNGKSLSSVFAKVKINKEYKTIDGETLFKLFNDSQNKKAEELLELQAAKTSKHKPIKNLR